MKKSIFISLVILVLAFSAFAQKGKAKVDPSKAVRAAFDTLIEGIKQSDVEKVMSVYDKSPRTLFFNSDGSITMGWDTMKTVREPRYAVTKNVTLEVEGIRVEMLGTSAAYVSCTWKQSQEFNGKLENASGRMTLIFKLVKKDWKVVHLHTSPNTRRPDRTYLENDPPNN
jgi:ketosteroid isomerase-like protein